MVIAFSFGVTGLICQYAVGMTYFNILNNFAIYVILGVAADDFFIFMDSWNQSEAFNDIKFDYEKRMAYTMRRASRTMFMTSSTTAVAFLATCFSPIMPIQAFGIYSAILVPMNFLLTCYFLPPCVILYEKTCKLNCCFICAKSKKKDETGQGQDSERPLKDNETDQKTKEPVKEEVDSAKHVAPGSGEAPGSALENEPEFKLKDG